MKNPSGMLKHVKLNHVIRRAPSFQSINQSAHTIDSVHIDHVIHVLQLDLAIVDMHIASS
jgi:hypothetical protein